MKSQLLISALIASASVAAMPLARAGELTVTISDIRSAKGSIMLSVVNSDAAWNSQEKPVAAQKIAASGQEVVLKFDLPAGDYAVQVMHDENENGKLDTNFMGMPIEGYGFSNNPQVMRRAHFDEAKFALGAAAASIVVRLR
jgi:uncharacterized protein (DUF2141 family)